MASNRIPDEISIHRPGPCTEVKLISGHYYVYMYTSVKLPSGKWGKKTGKCIGSIIPEKGFVPNINYSLYEEGESQDEISVLEYGQYALIEDVAKSVKNTRVYKRLKTLEDTMKSKGSNDSEIKDALLNKLREIENRF